MRATSGTRRQEGSRGPLKAPAPTPTTPDRDRGNGTVAQEAELVKALWALVEVQAGVLEELRRLNERLKDIWLSGLPVIPKG